jgi:hypothetical protein
MHADRVPPGPTRLQPRRGRLGICHQESVSIDHLQGVQAGEAYVLGFHACPKAKSGENVLTVYEFNSSAARDSTALNFFGGHGRAAGFGPQGSLWTYGPFLILLSGQRSDLVDQLAHNGLKDIGAH